MMRLLLVFVAGLVFCSSALGADAVEAGVVLDKETGDKLIATVAERAVEQEEHKAGRPTYLQIFKVPDARVPEVDVEVHVHDGPQGVGYTIYFEITKGDSRYKKAQGVGAHSNTYDWRVIPAWTLAR